MSKKGKHKITSPLHIALRIGRVLSMRHLLKLCKPSIRINLLSSMAPYYMPIDKEVMAKRIETAIYLGKGLRHYVEIINNEWLNYKEPSVHVKLTDKRPKKKLKTNKHAKDKNVHSKSKGKIRRERRIR